MTTSTSWGIPVRLPIPNIVGFSYYHMYWDRLHEKYKKAGGHYVRLHRLRARAINELLHVPTFIHELQCEPWAPKAIWQVSSYEQDKSMGPERIKHSIKRAKATGLYPIDFWGGEWWYWRHLQGDDSIWNAIQIAVSHQKSR